jgi:glycosyltransferase involved in cell wall biosynthesis
VLRASRALLFPSIAEGYGLPAVEAASIGLPVLATPLPVFREILEDYPVYLPGADVYPWVRAINALAEKQQDTDARRTGQIRRLPTWADHFNNVLSLI